MARKTSTIRMMIASVRPPKNPAHRPSVTPRPAASATAERPTSSEIRPP